MSGMARGRTERPVLFSAPMVRAILQGSKTQTRHILSPSRASFGSAPRRYWDHGDFARAYPDGHPSAGYLHVPSHDQACEECARMGWDNTVHRLYPNWEAGDHLWVRETIRADEDEEGTNGVRYLADDEWRSVPKSDEAKERHFVLRCYRSTDPDLDAYKKVPAIHMPRWASRITLEVTEVRVDRLQSISEDDAIAEGVESPETEREDHDWSICYRCGGTGLYNGLGADLGVIPDCDCFECDTHVKRYRRLWEHINGAGSWDANPFVIALTFRRVANAP